jgi:signal transduction histidine kinase
MMHTRHLLQAEEKWKPDLIITNDDQATYDVLACGLPMTYTTPIVFGGVGYPNIKVLKEHHNVTGWRDKIDIMKNLDFIADVIKKKPNVYTLLDSTYIDKRIMKELHAQLRDKKTVGFMTPTLSKGDENYLIRNKGYVRFNRYMVRYHDLRMASIFWNMSYYQKGCSYLQLKRDYTTINVGRISANPCFTAIAENFGAHYNLVGGYFSSFSTIAQEEVQTAARILRGEKASSIPIRLSAKNYYIDWEAAKVNHIKLKDIPPYARIINLPFKESHPIEWYLSIAVVAIVLLTAFGYLFVLYRKERRHKRLAYRELKEEREILELAIEGGNTFAWSLKDGKVYFENSFWKFINATPQALNKKEILSYIHPEYRRMFLRFYDNLPNNNSGKMQVLCGFKENNFSWWEIRYSTTTNVDGTTRTAGLLINVQDFKDKEKEMERTRLLVEKAEMKQSFIANLSHEIRTPLNAIVGFSNLLVNGDDLTKKMKEEYAKHITENNALLLKLIDEIFTLSQIESGILSLREERCSVKEIINMTYVNSKIRVPKYLKFNKEEEEADRSVIADEAHLIEVLTHFVNNASKFTAEGFITIGYHYNEDNKTVSFFVKDSGKGIPLEEQDLIFSRFYKRDIFMQGAGLGLSICKQLIERIGGQIRVESVPDKGSCFSVILPVRE